MPPAVMARTDLTKLNAERGEAPRRTLSIDEKRARTERAEALRVALGLSKLEVYREVMARLGREVTGDAADRAAASKWFSMSSPKAGTPDACLVFLESLAWSQFAPREKRFRRIEPAELPRRQAEGE
jgi:hypothetical protein